MENPSQGYGASPAVWDHTVLHATRHKWTRPDLISARQAGTRFTYSSGMEGWVDLGVGYIPGYFTSAPCRKVGVMEFGLYDATTSCECSSSGVSVVVVRRTATGLKVKVYYRGHKVVSKLTGSVCHFQYNDVTTDATTLQQQIPDHIGNLVSPHPAPLSHMLFVECSAVK